LIVATFMTHAELLCL